MKTKKELEHLKRVASLGCIICDSPQVQVHHIRNRGKGLGNVGIGNRSSHYETIPLCYNHHLGAFSIHNNKLMFEKRYGTEEELLKKTREKLNGIANINDSISSR